MKTSPQTKTATKPILAKPFKTAVGKSKAKIKSGVRSATKVADSSHATLSGYSDQANRYLKRGKVALGDAYAWVGETGRSLPDHRSVETYVSDRPLILGAVGLGIGVVLGAMLPSMSATQKPAAKSIRRK